MNHNKTEYQYTIVDSNKLTALVKEMLKHVPSEAVLVGRGSSGISICGAIMVLAGSKRPKKDLKCNFVRKDNERSHGDAPINLSETGVYCFVDDLIDSGTTLETCMKYLSGRVEPKKILVIVGHIQESVISKKGILNKVQEIFPKAKVKLILVDKETYET